MSEATDSYAKVWYHKQLDRLHEEAPSGDKTVPAEALRHLPVECLAEVLDLTFDHNDPRSFGERCLVEGDKTKFDEFIRAQLDIFERFGLLYSNHYRNMARIIAHHFIRKVEEKMGYTRPSHIQVKVPMISRSPPSSGPPTPCTVLSWINNVVDSASQPGTPTPECGIFEQHSDPAPEALQCTATRVASQRPRLPRKAKNNSKPGSLPPKRIIGVPSGRGHKAAGNEPIPADISRKEIQHPSRGVLEGGVERRLGRHRLSEEANIIPEQKRNEVRSISTAVKKIEGRKRQRAGNNAVLHDDLQTRSKRRKTDRPLT